MNEHGRCPPHHWDDEGDHCRLCNVPAWAAWEGTEDVDATLEAEQHAPVEERP